VGAGLAVGSIVLLGLGAGTIETAPPAVPAVTIPLGSAALVGAVGCGFAQGTANRRAAARISGEAPDPTATLGVAPMALRGGAGGSVVGSW
jgi:hypothetical protein